MLDRRLLGSFSTHLFGTPYLLQEGAELLGLCVQSSAHRLVVSRSIRLAGKVRRADLEWREETGSE